VIIIEARLELIKRWTATMSVLIGKEEARLVTHDGANS